MKGLIISIGLLFGIITLSLIGYGIFINYQYENKIGSYFENAEDSITPELILEQLTQGKQAMINEGLTPEMYGAIIFKKPNNKMSWQYAHIDGIIERAKAVADWKAKSYSESGTSESLGDVYNTKMDNLRKYISAEGFRSDWIAKSTWYIKYHPIWYLFDWVLILLFIILTFVTLGVGFGDDY